VTKPKDFMFLPYFHKYFTLSSHYHIEPIRKWGTTPRRWEFLPQVILINPLFLSTSYSFNFERRNEGTKGLAVCFQCLCNLASAIRVNHSIIFSVNDSFFLSAKAFPVYLFLCANSSNLYSLKSSQSGITS
jgi:hypothetical protein